MLANSVFQSRRQQVLTQMVTNSVAIIPSNVEVRRSRDTEFLFRQDSDFWYLTGFNEPDSWLVLTKDSQGMSQHILFCRAKDKMAEIWQGRRLGAEAAKQKFALDNAFAVSELDNQLLELLDKKTCVYWPFGEHEFADVKVQSVLNRLRSQGKVRKAPNELKDLRSILHEMRLIKSEQEIAIMRQAAQISAQAHIRAMQFVEPGKFEFQVEAELHHEFAMQGARSPAYGSIVAGGDNANILHYTENQDELQNGDLLLIDAGGELQGYAADITRTFPVNGQFTEPQALLYQLVLDAQTESMRLIKPGNTIKQATDKAIEVIAQGLIDLGILSGTLSQVIEQKTYRQFFMHGLSHWLGLDVHDVGEYKLDDQDRPLLPGMVLTVEPGIYIAKGAEVDPKWQGIGIRIEDNVVITEQGYENLTCDAPKTIDEIQRIMAQ
ncbi:Xaa-Pro aminopeptidase [Saccharobesus litoralis]|uniref:Xaa-Pro aminopeptidase n=1 Tax=Saccharobesus litoralis TaxID=2172099 RepID=A0A2S0VW00_9ALTE|nr:Xaa-Pro aminopeptidase [Saccharobesus litoralis]AWB68388.1 Xaa-Pro aminopeptidase [Saccharobesus litoralis]